LREDCTGRSRATKVHTEEEELSRTVWDYGKEWGSIRKSRKGLGGHQSPNTETTVEKESMVENKLELTGLGQSWRGMKMGVILGEGELWGCRASF